MTTPPGGEPVGDVPVVSNDDVVRVRQIVRSAADSAGFSLVDQTKIVTAASELARNTLVHGGGGTVVIERSVNDRRKAGLRIVFTDRGPGIPDVEQALTDGWSTGNGLGLGLSGARRLVDEFTLESAVGEGTTVTVVKWIR
ncbi:serine/threonine-protein kinase RsbT [Actinomadura hallensis]|uniref:Serine/threonine-protein kinase RsbT n=1 Tax=Actinomadura hallensis TaxID=337895 RepID=A0A543IM91_9ACTN|nr:anti-sigma regulatory factor [Actinomadura hallensis]TQM71700.1 serine/threonine-protein kinase RsbT [Actinomadura hallensis]